MNHNATERLTKAEIDTTPEQKVGTQGASAQEGKAVRRFSVQLFGDLPASAPNRQAGGRGGNRVGSRTTRDAAALEALHRIALGDQKSG